MSTRTLQRLFADAEAVLDPPDGVASRGVMFVLRGLRVEHAAGLLIARPSRPLHAVLRASGFTSPSTFHRAFREFTGLTPNEYRRQWVPQAEQTEVGA